MGYLPLIRKDSITHMHGLVVYVRTSFCKGTISQKICGFFLTFSTGFTSLCLTSFSPIDHLCLYPRFFILFHLTEMRFSRSTHLLMCLPLETLTSILRTDLPIMVELIDLVNSVIIFLSRTTLLKW